MGARAPALWLGAGLLGGGFSAAWSDANAEPFPAVIELRSLLPALGGDGSDGVVFKGAQSDDLVGASAAGAGDVNGDGIGDLIIGAPGADRGSRVEAGASYVIFGRTSGFVPTFGLATLHSAFGGDGSEGFVLHGIDGGDLAGYSVAGIGDVNGDGIDDLAIGARWADVRAYNTGESYVVFGRSSGFPAEFPLRSLHPGFGGDGSRGFILEGIDRIDYSGSVVSGVGDVNGDGVSDLMIAAPRAEVDDDNATGESYVVFGSTTGFPAVFALRDLTPDSGGDGSAGFVLEGEGFADHAGRSVSGAGDVNGDGVDDVVVGSYDSPGGREVGSGYVVFGRTTGFPPLFELRSLDPAFGGDGTQGFIARGIDDEDLASFSVSVTGDLNGDDIDDLLFGAPRGDPDGKYNAGESYVLFGRSTGFPPEFELRHLHPALGGDGSEGFILNGILPRDEAGFMVSGAGDLNQDGLDDLVIGSRLASPGGRDHAGQSYIVFGRDTGFPALFGLASLHPAAGGDGSQGFIVNGIDPSDPSHNGTTRSGDIDGDGIDDLVIGASGANPNGQSGAGETYLIFGRAADTQRMR